MGDLEDVIEKTRLLRNQLTEFISEDNITHLDNFAFEFAYQESIRYKLGSQVLDQLGHIRRYQTYQHVYDVVSRIKKPEGMIVFELDISKIPQYLSTKQKKLRGRRK